MINIILSILGSFLVCVVLNRLMIPVLLALKAGQSIREVGPTWHNGKNGTPIMGGLVFIFGAALCLLVNLPFMKDHTVFYVLLMSCCFGFIGFLDDFAKVRHHRNLGLTSLQKLLLQMAVAALFVYVMYKTGGLTSALYIPFVNITIHIHPILNVVFCMFVVVGCVNSVNLTDGIDGLSASVTIPVMVFFVAAAIAMGKLEIALLPASLIGGLAAYLCYNWHPAKLFMGDTGSLFLGGAVCSLAIALDMPLILILVGFVYIVETLSDILQVSYFKLTHGKRLFKMAPIHHHFEMCGWKEEKIVLVFTSVSALMCILAWFGISGLTGR